MVAATKPEPVMEAFVGLPVVAEVVARGETKTSALTADGLQIDVRVVAPGEFGAALLYFTGSKTHNIELRQRAIDRGMLLSEYGLFQDEAVVASETEADIYAALEMEFVPPPMREGSGEVAAAAGGGLPPVIRRSDIRGDLHYHSNRSGDSQTPPEDMIEAAIGAGYEYVAFTEHGEDLAINGSSREQMLAHRDRLRSLDESYPEIRVLFGCELNIGPDGDLDYDQADSDCGGLFEDGFESGDTTAWSLTVP